MPSTVLVTGGAGFIGSHLVPLLLERGDRVRVLDNMSRGDRDRVAGWAATGRVELVEADVRYGGAVHQAMAGCDQVVHLAAVSINKSQADPDESIDINVVGSNNVFRAAADHGVRRLVFASSASVYGDPETLPMSEDGPVRPLTPYCIAKHTGEQLLDYWSRRSALTWIALRFFNVYGPGQKPTAYYTSVINHFVQRLRDGRPPVIDGRGEQSMDFVHVHDVARAIVMALDVADERAGQVVNVGTGVDTSVAELARTLVAAVGADVEPQFRPRDVLVSRRAADVTRALDVLGWKPTIDLATGMQDLVDAELARPGTA
jgi:UDP-glucose 4-epimerase